MTWHWQDVYEPRRPSVWKALRVTALGPKKPSLRVEACKPRCLRIVASCRPVLWARIAVDYGDYDAVRGVESGSLGVLPPLVASQVDEMTAVAEPQRAPAWSRLYARLLETSPVSPVHEGEWLISLSRPGSASGELPPQLIEQIVAQKAGGTVDWDYGTSLYPFTLRTLSSAQDGRVKAWRKHVRAGTLPPILLHWVSGFDAPLVLDGHDRLLAAALEGASASSLTLLRVSVEPADLAHGRLVQDALETSMAAAERLQAEAGRQRLARVQRLWSVEHANALLLGEFATRLELLPSRAWPLPGGVARWAREVEQATSAQGVDSFNLLEGLEHHLA